MNLQSKSGLLSRIATILLVLLACVPAVSQDALQVVTGTVTYPDGRPAVGVKIAYTTFVPDGKGGYGEVKSEAVTDNLGEYKAELKQGITCSKGTFGDYCLRPDRFDSAEIGGKPIQRDYQLVYLCLVLGEVTDAATFEPIEGVKVDMQSVTGGYEYHTETGKDGVFRKRILPDSKIDLHVGKAGYAPKTISFSSEETDVVPFRITLEPGGMVTGRVLDDKGNPISDVRVDSNETWGPYYAAATCRTDKDGYYRLNGVSIGKSVHISVFTETDDILSVQANVTIPEGSKEASQDFKIKRTEYRNITGNITDSNGVPITGAQVRFGIVDISADNVYAKTDSSGNYRLEKASTRKWMMVVTADGYAPAYLSVPEGGDQIINAKLDKGHTASGRVVDPEGKPLPNVTLGVRATTPMIKGLTEFADCCDIGPSVTTDADGRFTLTSLPVDGVIVDVYERDYDGPYHAPIRVDATDNVIAIRGIPQLGGKVVDAETRQPIKGFTVKWGFSEGESNTFNTNDGTFKVRIDEHNIAKDNTYKVKAFAKGYLGEEKDIKSTDFPNVDYSTVFALKKTKPIKGKVVDPIGRAIKGATITIVENGGYDRYSSPIKIKDFARAIKTTTNKDGVFVFEDAPTRIATVIVESKGWPQVLKEKVDLLQPLNIEMPTGATLEIIAKRFAGKHSHYSLSRYPDHEEHFLDSKKLSEDGRAVATDIEPGTYRLAISGNRMNASRVLELRAGEKQVYDLDADQPIIINGVVTKLGKPVSGVRVCSYSFDMSREEAIKQRQYSCETDDQGRYLIAAVIPGRATVMCTGRFVDVRAHTVPSLATAEVNLKNGENTLNLTVPGGVISGKLVDAAGKPLEGEIVEATSRYKPLHKEQNPTGSVQGIWAVTSSMAKTAKDGSFTLDMVPDEVVVVVKGEEYTQKYIGQPIAVDPKKPVTGLTIQLLEPGKVAVTSMVDQETGEPLQCLKSLWTKEGVPYHHQGKLDSPEPTPAGNFRLWAHCTDGYHMPAYADIEVKPGKTAKIKMEIPRTKQRIVFSIAKDSKLYNKENLGVLYTLKDAATGKPVLAGALGEYWGSCEKFGKKSEVAVPLNPGTYELAASIKAADEYENPSGSDLWKTAQKVTLKEGVDAVIEVK